MHLTLFCGAAGVGKDDAFMSEEAAGKVEAGVVIIAAAHCQFIPGIKTWEGRG